MYARYDQTAHMLSCPQDKRWVTVVMESCVMRKYHAQFGERDRETHLLRERKVRSVPTPRSPVLANMTLDGLEKKLREKFPKPPRKSSKEKVNFIRFADDFLIDFQVQRGVRRRGETTRGAIYERKGVRTFTGKDPHHAY
jgi:hypothetical protein